MSHAAASPVRDWSGAWRACVETLFPGYFALVMATGIISNGMWFEGHRGLSDLLLAVNAAAYLVLAVMTVARVALFPRAVWRDLTDPNAVFGFFTLVAATDVLGVGLGLRGYGGLTLGMWGLALLLWLGLTWLGFMVLMLRGAAARMDIIYGGWLVAIVATEAVAVHGVLLTTHFAAPEPLLVFSYMLWGVGVVLYAIFIVLFAHRVFFAPVKPEQLTSMLWVVMGAAAISTNAGTELILTDSTQPFLRLVRPFIEGAVLVIWAWATWWIPLLVSLAVWMHSVHHRPLSYTPLAWAFVFPLGMYALASLRLAHTAGLSALAAASHIMVWIALAAWVVTALGLVDSLWRHWPRRQRGTQDHGPAVTR